MTERTHRKMVELRVAAAQVEAYDTERLHLTDTRNHLKDELERMEERIDWLVTQQNLNQAVLTKKPRKKK